LPQLVDLQQTGFIAGHQIFDNILSTHKLLQEGAQHSRFPLAMLRLNFTRAYDSVDHNFLGRVMENLGFSADFFYLVRGLDAGEGDQAALQWAVSKQGAFRV
jgi:hypothetical protein